MNEVVTPPPPTSGSAETSGDSGGKLAVPIGIQRILQLLPHRYPFLLLDRIIAFEPRVRIVALKNVTVNEPFFQGHFPGQPIMPGVLLLEALAQAGAVLIMHESDRPEEKLIFFTGVDECRFRRPVVPGDQLHLHVDVLVFRRNVGRMKGQVMVDGKLVAEAMLSCHVVDRSRE